MTRPFIAPSSVELKSRTITLQNDVFDGIRRVGSGSPVGKLLRQFWLPVGPTSYVTTEKATRQVRILGEDLVLYRDLSGGLGLIQERCPHQRISLAYGRPEVDGIRCMFHGWRFDHRGRCLEQPVPADASDDANAVAYAVEELGGLAFAYFGPEPAPALPHYDLLLADDRIRHIGVTKVPWPWLDSLAAAKLGAEFLFPVTLTTGTVELPALEFHVPVDDTHTLRVLCRTYLPVATERPSTEAYEIPWRPEDDDRMEAAGARGGEPGHPAILEELLGQLGRTPTQAAQLPGENRANGVFHHGWGHHQSGDRLDSATVSQERLLAYMPPPTGSIMRGVTTR